MPLRLQSLLGLFAFIGLAWLLSSHKSRIPVRAIVGGLALQMAVAVLVLKTRPGRAFFVAANDAANAVLECVDAGCDFVFGEGYREHYFAFRVLGSIVFFSSLMAVLHHWLIVPAVVRAIGGVMRIVMGTSGAESLSAAADIFVGQSEAPLVIRPYLDRMTASELMSVMVGGFATVAGGVLVAYVEMGISAGHLITASIIAAPAALLVAKVIQPETEVPETTGATKVDVPVESVNTVDAAATGAADGVKLAINVGAQILAFLALIALVNLLLGEAGERLGQEWSLQKGLGYLCWPIAWLMGVEPRDCYEVGQLVGLKTVANEFIAYKDLAALPAGAISDRSRVLATYALCGFASPYPWGYRCSSLDP
jgi:CNT family concentrative nucleoside transporter